MIVIDYWITHGVTFSNVVTVKSSVFFQQRRGGYDKKDKSAAETPSWGESQRIRRISTGDFTGKNRLYVLTCI